jgi:hypothetical protein
VFIPVRELAGLQLIVGKSVNKQVSSAFSAEPPHIELSCGAMYNDGPTVEISQECPIANHAIRVLDYRSLHSAPRFLELHFHGFRLVS